jgi:hypothetical protein
MNILILTVHKMKPLHPRIEKEIEILRKLGYKVDFVSLNKIVENSRISNRFFRGLFFNPFFKNKVLKFLDNFKEYDCYIFYDLHLLDIAYAFKKLNPQKKVIYETIDDNLALYLYYNLKNISNYKFIESKILKHLRNLELKKAFELDAIIVNSKGLQKIFQNKAYLLYYLSIFNGNFLNQNPSNPNALIYLGGFSEGKGALESIELSKKFNIPLFIFGDISIKIKKIVENNQHIKYFGYLNNKNIFQILNDLVKGYFLFGISLIKPIHNSYKIQIANKEIDYINLGIPIIGNHREPTTELINKGCGIFVEEFDNNLIDKNKKKQFYFNTIKYSQEQFSLEKYENVLKDIFNEICKN